MHSLSCQMWMLHLSGTSPHHALIQLTDLQQYQQQSVPNHRAVMTFLGVCILTADLCLILLHQAAAIVAESGGSVFEAHGELITLQYFDSLAAEVNELLQVGACESN